MSLDDEHLLMLNALNHSSMESVSITDDLLMLLEDSKDFLNVQVEEKVKLRSLVHASLLYQKSPIKLLPFIRIF